MNKPKYKVGNKIICVNPDGRVDEIRDGTMDTRGGAGWRKWKIGIIHHIRQFGDSYIYWLSGKNEAGIYEEYIQKYPWSFKEAVKRIKDVKCKI